MLMEKFLNKKVIVITGGAGVLGAEFGKSIVERGGAAIIADVELEAAKRKSEEINSLGYEGKAYAYELDITKKESILELIESLDFKFGKIDALVNNAYPRNSRYGKHFFDVEYEDFCENISLNLGGNFLSSQQFASYFLKKGCGNIINISSIYGVVAPRFEIYENTTMTTPVEYIAIKSAVIHLTRYMVKYLKDKNVRINCISPGGILDGQPEKFIGAYKNHTANKGMLDKKDVCGALLWLLSDLSKYVNGQNIIVDDGFVL
jgi:NAD(P)-dependent dehydrogenase (short-subunit alcohol dehydrogenase family)